MDGLTPQLPRRELEDANLLKVVEGVFEGLLKCVV